MAINDICGNHEERRDKERKRENERWKEREWDFLVDTYVITINTIECKNSKLENLRNGYIKVSQAEKLIIDRHYVYSSDNRFFTHYLLHYLSTNLCRIIATSEEIYIYLHSYVFRYTVKKQQNRIKMNALQQF